MKICILGSEGFLGTHIREQAEAMGIEVFRIDKEQGAHKRIRIDQLTPVNISGFDWVYNLGGLLGTGETFDHIQEAVKNNILNAIHVADCCQRAGVSLKYVTLGNNWLNPYSITKNCAAHFCRMYAKEYRLPAQVAVTYNCFGSGQKAAPVRKIIPDFMTRLIREQPLEVFGDGSQIVDMVYAPDFARAILTNNQTGTLFYGTSAPLTVLDVALKCRELFNSHTPITFLPMRRGETGDGVISPYPMPEITDLDLALKLTADWYKGQSLKPGNAKS